MQYALDGFNQEKLLAVKSEDGTKLDLTDIKLMGYILRAIPAVKMKRIYDENNQPYVWLEHKHILEDLPILDIKERALQYRLEKLEKLGLIKSKVIASGSCRGTKTYYGITELLDSLQFSEDDMTTRNELHMKNTTTRSELHMKERADANDCVSNSKLTIDSKLNSDNNTILKNSTAEPSLDNSETKDIKPKRRVLLNDDFSSKGYDTAKEEKKQTKRLNMYDKCILEIDNYTDDDKLKEALKSYLSIRLKMTDKKLLGVNQFKGLLKTLSDLNGDKVAIVEKATERGWASFYELKDYQYSNRNNYRKTDCSVFGETPQMRSVLPEEVEGGESSGIIF